MAAEAESTFTGSSPRGRFKPTQPGVVGGTVVGQWWDKLVGQSLYPTRRLSHRRRERVRPWRRTRFPP
jgi:hypothetical protein